MRVVNSLRRGRVFRVGQQIVKTLKPALATAVLALPLLAVPGPASAIYENGTSDTLLLGAFPSQAYFAYTGSETRTEIVSEEIEFLQNCLIILRAEKRFQNELLRGALARLKSERNKSDRIRLFNEVKAIGAAIVAIEKKEGQVRAELQQARLLAQREPPPSDFQLQTRTRFFSLDAALAEGAAYSSSRAEKLDTAGEGLTVTPTAANGGGGAIPIHVFAKARGRAFDEDSQVDRDGGMAGVTAGVMFGLSPALSAGIAFNYTHFDASSRFLNTKLDMDSYGLSVFFNSTLPNKITLDGLFRYDYGEADINFGVSLFNRAPITGSFDTDTFSFAARLGRKWRVARKLWVEPNATVRYSILDRDAFVDSLGVQQAGSTLDHGRVSAGARLGHSFVHERNGSGEMALSHGTIFGAIEGVYDFEREDKILVVVGPTNFFADTDPAGFNLAAGGDFAFTNGVSVSVLGQYQWRGDYEAVGGALKLAVPLN